MGIFGDPISSEMGGPGGDPFSDLDLSGSSSNQNGISNNPNGFDWRKAITKVELRAGDTVDAIRMK